MASAACGVKDEPSVERDGAAADARGDRGGADTDGGEKPSADSGPECPILSGGADCGEKVCPEDHVCIMWCDAMCVPMSIVCPGQACPSCDCVREGGSNICGQNARCTTDLPYDRRIWCESVGPDGGVDYSCGA